MIDRLAAYPWIAGVLYNVFQLLNGQGGLDACESTVRYSTKSRRLHKVEYVVIATSR